MKIEIMTQEDKELLIKDLSARLPYGVKAEYKNEIFDIEHVCAMYELDWLLKRDLLLMQQD